MNDLYNSKLRKKIEDLFVSTIIAAAGSSTRMEMGKNKQFIRIKDVPVLARTLKVFDDCRFVDEIILVVNEKDIVYCKNNIVESYYLDKVKVITAGGKERQKSVYNGLMEVNKQSDIVIVHDGARPFIRNNTIIKNLNAAVKFGAVCTAVPVKDTIKLTDENGFVKRTLDRQALWNVQTPQTFWYKLLVETYEKAIKEELYGTDDATLVEKAGYNVKLVMGSYDNIKITTREDLIIGDAISRYIL